MADINHVFSRCQALCQCFISIHIYNNKSRWGLFNTTLFQTRRLRHRILKKLLSDTRLGCCTRRPKSRVGTSYFPHCSDRIPDRNSLRQKGFIQGHSQGDSPQGRESLRAGLYGGGYTVSAVWKRRKLCHNHGWVITSQPYPYSQTLHLPAGPMSKSFYNLPRQCHSVVETVRL